MHLLLIDNYDSFTYNLVDYFTQLGARVDVKYNDDNQLFNRINKYNAIVLSPGPKRPKDAGNLMPFIHEFHNKKPMLGICLGHQAIGEYFGARLVIAQEPMHGRTSKIFHDEHTLFYSLTQGFNAMRYHSLLLQDLPDTLMAIAYTEKNEIMAIAHRSLPLYGVQFHPESILTTDGMMILHNWLEVVTRIK